MAFRFVDLFAGIGGFHAAATMLRGDLLLASEVDEAARSVYGANWLTDSSDSLRGDITTLAPPTGRVKIPSHEVLTAGFPCQPFSKSGAQEGTRDRTRGTLYFNILRIAETRRPPVILLENVRNIAGPRHTDTWATIIATLRDAGYQVSSTPAVMSPHLLPPSRGGTPQIRDRVFIGAVYVGKRRAKSNDDVPPPMTRHPVDGWNPEDWDIESTPLLATGGMPLLQKESELADDERKGLTEAEVSWISAWDDFLQRILEARSGERLPGFPLWVESWVDSRSLRIPSGTPEWKANFLRKNADFYTSHKLTIDNWLAAWNNLEDFPPSRRKLEWQARDAKSIWDCAIHLRPSGLRVKLPNYLPALVAISQTPIIGPQRRKLSLREAARLQGLPDSFTFGNQSPTQTLKQLGNGVSIGVVYFALRELVLQNADALPDSIVDAIVQAGPTPDYGVLRALNG